MLRKNNKKKLPLHHLSKIISLLGKILGQVIINQEGKSFFNKVERIRILSKDSRGVIKNGKQINKKFNQLKLNIIALKSRESLVVARSFSQFLNFCNLAESLFNVHKVHNYSTNKTQLTKEFIVLEEAISKLLKNKSISKNKFYEIAKNIKIDLVLTAHPTEVKRRTLIQKYHTIIEILEQRNLFKNFPAKLNDSKTERN